MKNILSIFCSVAARTGLYLSLCSLLSIACATAYAAAPELSKRIYPAAIDSPSLFTSQGAFFGGEAGHPRSLLKVELATGEKKNWEKVIIQLGDDQGIPLKNKLGYFFARVEKQPPRIVIDLHDIAKTAVDEKGLREALKSSRWVKSGEMTMDPEDHSTNINLLLSEAMAVAVYSTVQASIQSAVPAAANEGLRQIVIDIRPRKERGLSEK